MFTVLTQVDQSVLLVAYHIAASSPALAVLAAFLAQWLPYCAICFVIVYELFMEEGEKSFFQTLRRFALPTFFAWVVVLLLKLFIHEPRPFVGELDIVPLVSVIDPFGSFPSAHATVFGSLFGAMFSERFRFWRAYGVIALLVALGRVATGVHWPSDVLVGLLWGAIVGFFGAKYLEYRSRNQAQG